MVHKRSTLPMPPVFVIVWIHCVRTGRDACTIGRRKHDLVGGVRASRSEAECKYLRTERILVNLFFFNFCATNIFDGVVRM